MDRTTIMKSLLDKLLSDAKRTSDRDSVAVTLFVANAPPMSGKLTRVADVEGLYMLDSHVDVMTQGPGGRPQQSQLPAKIYVTPESVHLVVAPEERHIQPVQLV
jgi:hypothetical protein